jgi:phosphoribosylaminoimidazolecarboxamide formyltransferase/IMP cyclohydrolase
LETREVFGIAFEQRRNDIKITPELLKNIVTVNKDLPQNAITDLLVALVTLKFTQSNSVTFTLDGQVIGNGAGQQSRIHCTRLAASKADLWKLRQHPAVLELPFLESVYDHHYNLDNAIDQYLRDDITQDEIDSWKTIFKETPKMLTKEEKSAWIAGMTGVSLGSDAFFPFNDSIGRAAASGVKYISQPGGSVREENIIQACDKYGMVMAFSGVRLFHH